MAENPNLFHHILVPTDGSETSIRAGKLAIRLAACQEACLTLVYVVDDAVTGELAGASGQGARQVQADLEKSGQRYLDYLSRLAAAAELAVNQVIRHGEPYKEISELASEQNVDLIVIGQVGSRGLRRVLIGRVTERVIEHAPCPVLVVK
jgi:nucleotide-binding universal stress UspA family protein